MDTAIVSGPGRQLAAIAAALRKFGIHLRIFAFQHTRRERTAYREFLDQIAVEHVTVPFARRIDFAMLSSLRRQLAEFEPHIVQTHSYRPTTLAWLLRRQGAGWRWIGFFHGTTSEDYKVRAYHWLDRRLLPSADRIVVMSRSQVGRFAGHESKVVLVNNAVLPASSRAAATGTSETLPGVAALPRPRIGVVGRLSNEKGVDVLLRAAAVLHHAGTRPVIVVAGDGPERSRLEALAASLSLGDTVHFLGSVLPIEPLYPLLDLVVIPSRSEGLPNVLLEAFRADVPVVASRVGAVPDVVGDTAAAVLTPAENPEALARAIEETLHSLDDPTARAARADVVAAYSLDARVAAHLRLYREVLSSPNPHPATGSGDAGVGRER